MFTRTVYHFPFYGKNHGILAAISIVILNLFQDSLRTFSGCRNEFGMTYIVSPSAPKVQLVMTSQPESFSFKRFILRFTMIAAVAWYFLYAATHTPSGWYFIDNVDLVIHEAGHVLFALFGTVVYVFGGSLTQVLLPVVFLFAFLKQGSALFATVMGSWAGYNLVNVGVYMADSIPLKLPILGGDESMHDWLYLFFHFGILSSSPSIGFATIVLGRLVILLSFFVGTVILLEEKPSSASLFEV